METHAAVWPHTSTERGLKTIKTLCGKRCAPSRQSQDAPTCPQCREKKAERDAWQRRQEERRG